LEDTHGSEEQDQRQGRQGRIQGAARWTHVEGLEDSRRQRSVADPRQAQGEVTAAARESVNAGSRVPVDA
jgi:hypothetical protein